MDDIILYFTRGWANRITSIDELGDWMDLHGVIYEFKLKRPGHSGGLIAKFKTEEDLIAFKLRFNI
jgi:hypothetical protein